jgi:hypothetical protein
MTYSLALRKNGGASIQSIAPLLSLACLEDNWNGAGLEENLKQVFLAKVSVYDEYSRDDAAHDSRYLFLLIKNGIISTTETRNSYSYVNTRDIMPE